MIDALSIVITIPFEILHLFLFHYRFVSIGSETLRVDHCLLTPQPVFLSLLSVSPGAGSESL